MGRRSFSREFKLEAVRLVRERGVSVAQAAGDLDPHQNMLRNWVRDFAADPAQAFPGQGQMKPEQAEIERLRREVQKLKAERWKASSLPSRSSAWPARSTARGTRPEPTCSTTSRGSITRDGGTRRSDISARCSSNRRPD